MATFKVSSRVVAPAGPMEYLYRGGTDDLVSLEDVLRDFWETRISEVRSKCLQVLEKSNFRPTSSLRTRAHLRDTFFKIPYYYNGEISERLLVLYLWYSRSYWIERDFRPKDISGDHLSRRRSRVMETAYLFLVKMYCGDVETELEHSPSIFKALLKNLLENYRRSKVSDTDKFELAFMKRMLLGFLFQLKEVKKNDPIQVGQWFESALVLTARYYEASSFSDHEVYLQFRKLVRSIESGIVVPTSGRNTSMVEKELLKQQLLATANVLCKLVNERESQSSVPR